MNHELFSSMHDILDFIIAHYDNADDAERLAYCQHIQELKETNDYVMDHWVSFEEKLALFFEKYLQLDNDQSLLAVLPPIGQVKSTDYSEQHSSIGNGSTTNDGNLKTQMKAECNECDLLDIDHPNFEKAIGYYKLLMFKQSFELLQDLLLETPECNRARLYYAMCLLHLQKWDEAKRQFQLITVLSDFPKWLALSYNALGCLQAIACHMGEAEKMFRRAYQIYPQFDDALKNLECCSKGKEDICLYFGSTELISM